NYKLSDDMLSLFLELQHRSENNDKVKISQYRRSSSDLWDIVGGLVSDTQSQGSYFKKIQLEDKKESESIDVLQNINLGHQKTIEKNKKSIDVLQNINLVHQKMIEEKDNQILQLNE